MLSFGHNQRGVSLIELLVGLAIIGILAAIGAPALSKWVQNTQIRTTADAILSGLQLARAEAVRRNTQIRFQLVSSLDSGCALSTTASNWVVSFDDPTGLCDQSLLDDTYSVDDTTNNPAPRMIQTRASAEGSGNSIMAADQSTIIFNGLGRVTPVLPASGVTFAVSTTAGACATTTSDGMGCRNVVVNTGGQIRMCNPAKSSSDPQGC